MTVDTPRKHELRARRDRATIALLAALAVVWFVVYRQLHPFALFVTDHVLHIPRGTSLDAAMQCLLWNTPRILMLLPAVILAVGLLRSFFPPERARRLLAGRREWVGVLLAALLGVATPFCSCSAVPLFLGFVEAGVPLSACFTFLVASPMVNEVALVLLLGMFGWEVAALYAGTGLALAMASGWAIGRLHGERYVEEWVYQVRLGDAGTLEAPAGWAERAGYAWGAVREVMGRVWPYVLAGLAAGLLIRVGVPEGLLGSVLGRDAWWAVPAAVLLGVPIYASAAGIIPVVHALLEKGAALGTALAFMMAVVGLSLPEWVILRRVLKPRLIAAFIGILTAGMILVGWTFNAVLPPRETPNAERGMQNRGSPRRVQVLGEECEECARLMANALQAARQTGTHVRVEKVTDFGKILEFGVANTPALAIDGRVVSAGKVLSPAEIRSLLSATASSPPPPPPE